MPALTTTTVINEHQQYQISHPKQTLLIRGKKLRSFALRLHLLYYRDKLKARINDVFELIVIQDIMLCHNVILSYAVSYRT